MDATVGGSGRSKKLLKPILKQSSTLDQPCSLQLHQKHAHFPPPELEARRFSGVDYDRTPIIVDQNSVQNMLPQRGCPGRTFYETVVQRHKRHDLPDEPLDFVMLPMSGANSFDPISYQTESNCPLEFSTFSMPPPTVEGSDSDSSQPSEEDAVLPFAGVTAHIPATNSIVEATVIPTSNKRKRLHRPTGDRNGLHKEGLSHSKPKNGKKPSEFSEWMQNGTCLGGF